MRSPRKRVEVEKTPSLHPQKLKCLEKCLGTTEEEVLEGTTEAVGGKLGRL